MRALSKVSLLKWQRWRFELRLSVRFDPIPMNRSDKKVGIFFSLTRDVLGVKYLPWVGPKYNKSIEKRLSLFCYFSLLLKFSPLGFRVHTKDHAELLSTAVDTASSNHSSFFFPRWLFREIIWSHRD